MEDEDGTCLLDVLCDPQALNDFLYGTNELQTEDLLINSSSGGGSLFTDAPSPGSLLGDGSDPPDSPPPGCVDLSFLEEALLSSPEGEEDPEEELGGTTPVQTGYEGKKGGVQCDILQQSLQEAQITEQTMALDPGGDNLSLYSPPFIPRDTQAAVDPPQPSLLAVGPGCPSLKPAAQLMGLLPGNVFPETFSLSSMILHRAIPRPLPTPLLRAPVPLLIQSKLPVSIQPRLVQISPKQPGQKQKQNQAPSLTFVPGAASPNIVLSPPPQKPVAPPQPHLPKQLSLQLVNPGSFLLQPHIFQGQNQYLLQGRAPVTISQHAARPLLGSSAGGPQILTVPPTSTPQILTVPPRQLNFSFTSPAGQLALRQVLSGPLQLQSGAPTVFQMPGAYAAGGPCSTLVHGPALGNHITLINSSGVLPPDLTSISIVNGPSVVQGRPFAARAPALQTEGPLSRQQASVVVLPERAVQEERGPEETLQQILQVLQPVTVQPPPAELQSPPPPAITVLQPPSEAPLPPHPAEEKLLMPPIDVTTLEEEATPLMSQNEAFIQHLQQAALSPPLSSELLAADLPMETLSSPDRETPPQSQDPAVQNLEASPIPLDPEDTSLSLPPSPLQDAEGQSFSPLVPPQSSDQIQIHVSQASFPQNQKQVQSSVSQPPSPPQPDPPSSGLSTGGDPPPVQQHTQHKPTAALLVEPEAFSLQPSSPAAWGHGQGQGPPEPRERTPTLRSLQTCTKPADLPQRENLTPATRRHRFQQRLCSDQASVQASLSGPGFPSLQDAVSRLLPFHCCAGELPTQQHFNTVDQEFETVSGFLLKRTKDMVNKYRQLLVREAQESPSAEMVMLERLFLQAERCALVEDRRRVRRDPESFLSAMTPSSSSLPPSSPPASWPRLSDRPPGLKTYRSSSRGALRLTIKHESGSRKVVHNSACEQGLKRDHKGQLINGGPHPLFPGPHPPLLGPHPPLLGPHPPLLAPQETPNGAHPPEDIPDTDSKLKPLSTPQIKGSPHREVNAPKVKCSRPDAPLPRPLQEDPLLNEHLQSAIDSILELQRLQGPSGAPPPGPCLDQRVSSALQL
ncbi:BRD4-interacting chromatin-remodeling complex-associated protein isoform X2 [Gymnodraco acuticeps]|uniref:BRD4-interacting chromatin-remodeling complex-associated protein isoform X2 n=1 Tax=Gymnodraco acuticeps TaxID=8218 RepID=A0A6P8WKY6_GYMAC|nr:BRD4-interacting chromatin-remodeling complex-associated protein isoform X2 [Gymnodraco acuticeps]